MIATNKKAINPIIRAYVEGSGTTAVPVIRMLSIPTREPAAPAVPPNKPLSCPIKRIAVISPSDVKSIIPLDLPPSAP